MVPRLLQTREPTNNTHGLGENLMSYLQAAGHFLTEARQNRYLAVAFRLILGGTFILAGIEKLPHTWELFIGLSEVLEILHIPHVLRQFVQLQLQWLPWIEIVVGTCLIVGLLTRLAALVSALMTTAFFIFNTARILLPTTEWCNCFGVTLHVSLPVAQVLDVTLLLMALLLLFHRRRHWSLDAWLLGRKSG